MNTEVERLFENLNTTPYLHQIFGEDPARTFRNLSKICHPDHAAAQDQEFYTTVFCRLNELYQLTKTCTNYKTALASTNTLIGSKLSYNKGSLTLSRQLHSDNISQTFTSESGYVRIAKLPSNNDLITNEATILKQLNSFTDPNNLEFIQSQKACVPTLLDTISITSNTKSYNCNILQSILGSSYTIEQVIKIYPSGLLNEHIYWIFRRCLLTLQYLKDAGIRHHGLNPKNIVVYDKLHGVTFQDFTNSSLLSRSRKYRDSTYDAMHGTDLEMVGNSMIYLASGQWKLSATAFPDEVKTFFEGLPKTKEDPHKLYTAFGKIIPKQKFVELTI